MGDMSLEVRVDPIIPSRVTIISTIRRYRPKEVTSIKHEVSNYSVKCPFCPGNEDLTPPASLALRLVDGRLELCRESDGYRCSDWIVRIFPNKYPVFSLDAAGGGFGYHEVVVETPKHRTRPHDLTPEEWGLAFAAAFKRVEEFLSDSRIRHAVLIKNYGGGGGASLEHTHMQIMGTSIIPPLILEEIRYSSIKYRNYGECPYCSIISSEINSPRYIYSNDAFVVLAAYAPRQSYEVCIYPLKHESMPMAEFTYLVKLGDALSRVLRAYLAILPDIDFNFWIHMRPKDCCSEFYHWHLELMPATPMWGGLEKGYGLHVVTTAPEEAAYDLKKYMGIGFS